MASLLEVMGPGIFKAVAAGGSGGSPFSDPDFLVPSARPILVEVRRAGQPLAVSNLTTLYAPSGRATRNIAAKLAEAREQARGAVPSVTPGSSAQACKDAMAKAAAAALAECAARPQTVAQSFTGPNSQGQLAELSNGCTCVMVDGVSVNEHHALAATAPPTHITCVRGEWGPTPARPLGAVTMLEITTDPHPGRSRAATIAIHSKQNEPANARSSSGTFLFQAPPGFAISAFHGRKGWNVDALGVYMAAAVPRTWEPETHQEYPDDFKAGVRTLLLCANRLRKEQQAEATSPSSSGSPAEVEEAPSGLGQLPRAALQNIAQQLNLLSYHTFEAEEDAGYGPITWQQEGEQPPAEPLLRAWSITSLQSSFVVDSQPCSPFSLSDSDEDSRLTFGSSSRALHYPDKPAPPASSAGASLAGGLQLQTDSQDSSPRVPAPAWTLVEPKWYQPPKGLAPVRVRVDPARDQQQGQQQQQERGQGQGQQQRRKRAKAGRAKPAAAGGLLGRLMQLWETGGKRTTASSGGSDWPTSMEQLESWRREGRKLGKMRSSTQLPSGCGGGNMSVLCGML